MFQANLLPGQGFQPLTIHEKAGYVSETGRPATSGYKATKKTLYGMITNASQKVVDQWKQKGHPVTHKIVQYGAMVKAKPTDFLVSHDGRKFCVQGLKNHGDLNVSVSYYVEERADLK